MSRARVPRCTPCCAPRRPRAGGFTLIELVLAMAVFMVLAGMVVYFMRQGLGIFAAGTRDTGQQDRIEAILERLEQHLAFVALPPSFDPPPPPPTDEERMAGREVRPAPPVEERLRGGYLHLRAEAAEGIRALPCPWFAFTMHSGSWPDARLGASPPAPPRGRAATRARADVPPPGAPGDAKPYVPATVDAAGPDTVFQHPRGLVEVCYVAVPEDPAFPGIATLYHGYRSPPGGAGSLLDPVNLDSLEKIRGACRPIGRVLHLEARWRRVFSLDWEPTSGGVGETDPYVGTIWDSTRALDAAFPLHRGPASLADPSDDVFPAWVRLTLTIPPREPPDMRGETVLRAALGPDARELFLEDPTRLLGPGPDERHLKVGAEWMSYVVSGVDPFTGRVSVLRAARGTLAAAHPEGAWAYVGLETSVEVPLVYRDRFAKASGEKARPGGRTARPAR